MPRSAAPGEKGRRVLAEGPQPAGEEPGRGRGFGGGGEEAARGGAPPPTPTHLFIPPYYRDYSQPAGPFRESPTPLTASQELLCHMFPGAYQAYRERTWGGIPFLERTHYS